MTQEAKVIFSISIATIIILVGGVLLLSKNQKSTENTKNDPEILIKPFNHKIGSDSAKVTIVEFADFQCPACAATHPVIKKILKDYKSKITFIYRHFPLPQHQNAVLAAKASEAAGEQEEVPDGTPQEKFWEMHDVLYEKQSEWSENEKADEVFIKYAKELGLDTEKFSKSLKSNAYEESIQTDKDDGISLGVSSTPTFFINGEKFQKPATYANFKDEIDFLLKK